MIDFPNLSIKRAIMHTIEAKLPSQDNASVNYESELVNLTEEVIGIIKQRLVDAAGKNSKAFELEISNTNSDSFFDLVSDLKEKPNNEFITISRNIADLLAENQKRTIIPGGYLVIIDAEDSETGLARYIIIKAEPHQALRLRNQNGRSQIELLRKVFLSPSQKLYKIGIIYEKSAQHDLSPSQRYGCFLYDDQFRADSHPAEYFYKDFLGFSVDSNAKIQCKRFYDKTEMFIKENISDLGARKELINALRTNFTVNNDSLITPFNFSQSYIPESKRDLYISQVVNELPSSFVKDSVLLDFTLRRRKIDFPKNINIVGPEELFDQRVEIINSEDTLNELNFDHPEYTIMKIKGKPFLNE